MEKEYTADEAALADLQTPKVTGMTPADAEAALEKKGLDSRTVGEGETVTAQVPAAGSVIPGESTVILYLGGAEPEEKSGELTSPPFTLNLRNRTLEKNGQRIKLTQVEYSIMRMFMENPGKALSREEILDLVWGRDYFGELKIVDVNIRRLRMKVEDEPSHPTHIMTVWGYGYRWEE